MAKKAIVIHDTSSESSSGDDMGFIWAQCENQTCQKWRKLNKEDFEKEGKQTENWYCKMNTDPEYNDCSKPEENWEIENYKYNQKFNLYSVVLVKYKTFPKWPAMITLCPKKKKYKSKKNSIYHVELFGNSHSHSWIDAYNIEEMSYTTTLKTGKSHKNYSKIKEAFDEAKHALVVTVSDRFKLVKFVSVVGSEGRKEEAVKPNRAKLNQKNVDKNNEFVCSSNNASPCGSLVNQEVFTDFSELHRYGICLLDQMQFLLTRLSNTSQE